MKNNDNNNKEIYQETKNTSDSRLNDDITNNRSMNHENHNSINHHRVNNNNEDIHNANNHHGAHVGDASSDSNTSDVLQSDKNNISHGDNVANNVNSMNSTNNTNDTGGINDPNNVNVTKDSVKDSEDTEDLKNDEYVQRVAQDSHDNHDNYKNDGNAKSCREGDLLSRINILEATNKELENSMQDKAMRFAAEMKNLQNRQSREIAEMRIYGSSGILKKIIGVLDNFDRAVEAVSDTNDEFYKGIVMIQKSLHDILKESGVSIINPLGEQFNPMHHESVSHVKSDQYDDNAIINVLQVGYMIGERLLRPAMVQVVKNS